MICSSSSNNCNDGDGNFQQLNDCGCCEDIRTKKITPVKIDNSPALSSVKYRVGTHSQFKATMLAALSKELPALKTRENDDLSIGIIDAWATVADVLTFYEERIANEVFLRTATERRSILELARAIAYELKPGVAASTFVAFTIDDTAKTLDKTLIDQGTKVQSIPEEGKLPQIFETAEKLEARPEWSELKPRLTEPLPQAIQGNRFYLKGTNTRLRPGDGVLAVKGSLPFIFGVVGSVKEDAKSQRTIIDIIPVPLTQRSRQDAVVVSSGVPTRDIEISFRDDMSVGIDLFSEMRSKVWTQANLNAYSMQKNIPTEELAARINFAASQQQLLSPSDIKVYALRIRTGPYGDKAPVFKTLPVRTQIALGGKDWDSQPPPIDMYSAEGNLIYLNNTYPDILGPIKEDNWIVIQQQSAAQVKKCAAYKVSNIIEEAKADFALSMRVTGLELDLGAEKGEKPLSNFFLRKTIIFVKSEPVELATSVDIDVDKTPIEGDTIILDRVVPYLTKGQAVAITGMEATLYEGRYVPSGLIKSEIAFIKDVGGDSLSTKLTLEGNLDNKYMIDTVKVNANVVTADHGETKQEVLGSGDPSQRQQEFTLRQIPLTFVPSSTTTGGAQSTIRVRIEDILWREVPSLYELGPDDHAYVVRIEDSGQARVIFGDGIRGRRLPAGSENIKAKYRVGIGEDGMVKAGQLSLLMDRPPGVRSVINPTNASGAENPEKVDDARRNAPLKVLTMNRIVSVKDFEDFARGFGGIGKASATWLWDGEKRIVHLTVASAMEKEREVKENSPLYQHLVDAINSFKDPLSRVKVHSFKPKNFNIDANLLVAQDRDIDIVKKNVMNALLDAFSFDKREFGQDVSLSEVMAIIQRVDGVVAVNIEHLYLFSLGAKATLDTMHITADVAHLENGKSGVIKPAELLTVNSNGINLGVMTQS